MFEKQSWQLLGVYRKSHEIRDSFKFPLIFWFIRSNPCIFPCLKQALFPIIPNKSASSQDGYFPPYIFCMQKGSFFSEDCYNLSLFQKKKSHAAPREDNHPLCYLGNAEERVTWETWCKVKKVLMNVRCRTIQANAGCMGHNCWRAERQRKIGRGRRLRGKEGKYEGKR